MEKAEPWPNKVSPPPPDELIDATGVVVATGFALRHGKPNTYTFTCDGGDDAFLESAKVLRLVFADQDLPIVEIKRCATKPHWHISV